MAPLNREQTRVIFLKSYKWLCKSRKKHHHNADIWDFIWRWDNIRDKIFNKFVRGRYHFGVQSRKRLSSGDDIDVYDACDSLKLKTITIILEKVISPVLSLRCYHVKGRGGLKGAVRDIIKNKGDYKFVLRTDVKSYYDSIDHHILIYKLLHLVKDSIIISYVWKYLKRTVDHDGYFFGVSRGLPMGTSLSPLLGAFYLRGLDLKIERLGVFYIRYMDDILIMAKTRWKLKRAICCLNHEFEELGLCKHPDKTFIGRIEKGFDFLGYRFGGDGLRVAKKSIDNFMTKALRLYEREPVQSRIERLGEYTKHWVRWTTAGLTGNNVFSNLV